MSGGGAKRCQRNNADTPCRQAKGHFLPRAKLPWHPHGPEPQRSGERSSHSAQAIAARCEHKRAQNTPKKMHATNNWGLGKGIRASTKKQQQDVGVAPCCCDGESRVVTLAMQQCSEFGVARCGRGH